MPTAAHGCVACPSLADKGVECPWKEFTPNAACGRCAAECSMNARLAGGSSWRRVDPRACGMPGRGDRGCGGCAAISIVARCLRSACVYLACPEPEYAFSEYPWCGARRTPTLGAVDSRGREGATGGKRQVEVLHSQPRSTPPTPTPNLIFNLFNPRGARARA